MTHVIGTLGGHSTGSLGRAPRALVVLLLAVAVVAPVQVMTAEPASAATWTLRDRFSREVVRPGDVDADPYHIEHVYEVQHRLQRLGLYDAAVDGSFGPVTELESGRSRGGTACGRPGSSAIACGAC
jgi:Putative peptidoglycan binding domain